MTSVFTDKEIKPDNLQLQKNLGSTYSYWNLISGSVHQLDPNTIGEWHYSGSKFGWHFRIKNKKRVVVYLLPRKGFFKTAFVFGKKATGIILNSNVNQDIKTQLRNAKDYAEGRGIRIDVTDDSMIRDLNVLIKIKISD